MQQGSVGDGDSAPRNSPKSSSDADGRVRVKLEAPESAEIFDVKREPQDDYHAVQHDFHFDRKPLVPPAKLAANSDVVGQCQPPPQGYPRPVTAGLSNSYGFPHFYAPQAMLPPSFHAARPGQERPIGKVDEHEQEQERYRVPVSGVASDSVFLHHEPHRYEMSDYHGKGYPGMAYAFRPSMQHRAAVYAGHHNNTGYRAAQYQNRKRKWGGAAIRGMPPSMPVSLSAFPFFPRLFKLSVIATGRVLSRCASETRYLVFGCLER